MIDHRISENIYYYTDFETFKLILQNGTLRFKESTTSNDLLDTKRLYDRLLPVLSKELQNSTEKESEKEFLKRLIQNNELYNTRISVVACFTNKADSRMLWDSYTMHRKDRESQKYNGVCIEFKSVELDKIIEKESKIDYKVIMPIIYGDSLIDMAVKALLSDFSKEVKEMQKAKDQSQDIIKPIKISSYTKSCEISLGKCIVYPMLKLMDGLEKLSPFCKHSFWKEEDEIRAVLSMKKAEAASRDEVKYCKTDDTNSYYYCDIPIDSKCISKVILGPEFGEEEKDELFDNCYKIDFSELVCVKSEGTGVIVNR